LSRRLRIAFFTPALLMLGVLLGLAFAKLPRFGDYRGPYGFVLNRLALPERHTTNVVAATVFDFRGFDTLGEEFILFASVIGVVLLLRREREEAPDRTVGSDAVRVVGALAVGGTILVGLWLVAFGYVTPGGGFQGGVIVAAGVVLLFFVASHRAVEPFTREAVLDPLEGLGVGAYLAVGLAALASGLPFLRNLFGPGVPGTLQSGGSIPLLNWASGVEVAAANLLLFSTFLEEYVVRLPRRGD
jgi:multicomponent Na+:H+ antiporter subunit B